MKIDRLKIADALVEAGIAADKASPLAREFGEAYDEAEKDMASMKDLEAINARSDARIEAALKNQIIWIGGIAFLVVSAIAALIKL